MARVRRSSIPCSLFLDPTATETTTTCVNAEKKWRLGISVELVTRLHAGYVYFTADAAGGGFVRDGEIVSKYNDPQCRWHFTEALPSSEEWYKRAFGMLPYADGVRMPHRIAPVGRAEPLTYHEAKSGGFIAAKGKNMESVLMEAYDAVYKNEDAQKDRMDWLID